MNASMKAAVHVGTDYEAIVRVTRCCGCYVMGRDIHTRVFALGEGLQDSCHTCSRTL